ISSSLRSKPAETPVTMLLSSARVVPASAQACWDSFCGRTLSTPSSTATATSSCTTCSRAPLPPLMATRWSSIFTSTPCGSLIGFFATLDIAAPNPSMPLSSGHFADQLAANIGLACCAIGHKTLVGGNDHHTQTAFHLRNVASTAIDTQTRRAHPFDLFDHRAAFEVLQLDGQGRLDVVTVYLISSDVTLILQQLGNGHLAGGR